jgi:diadenosine tetraphosphate (Ap4A) HIT family hydrolase
VAVCQVCQLLAARDRGEAPDWDCIARTPQWDVVHSNNTSLPGWLVLVLRRHVNALADLTDDEAAALGPLVKAVSVALRDTVGCPKTYAVQFAESASHQHVHVHVIPRYADQPPEEKGPGIFSRLGVDADERVSDQRMDEIAVRVRSALLRGTMSQ